MKTKEEKIKFLAELDGWKENNRWGFIKHWTPHDLTCLSFDDLPRYLYRYDAIIPLIQKQPRHILNKIGLKIAFTNDISECFKHTPESLADILIEVIENIDKERAAS